MLKDYHLLLNSTYLWILQHPYEKINYSKIAAEVGLTRQTVSKEYQSLQGLEDNIYNIKDFHGEELNKVKRAILIIEDLEEHIFTDDQYAIMLHVNRLTINKSRPAPVQTATGKMLVHEKDNGLAIYAILYNKEIIYIGSTTNFGARRFQHLHGIRQQNTTGQIYKYCAEQGIQEQDVQIVKLLENFTSKDEMLRLEQELIQHLSPPGNVNL